MVKTKGFTLIEIMVVVAILGILISVAAGPMADRHKTTDDTDWNDDMSEPIPENTIMINGVPHVCGEFGDCKPVE